MPNLNPTVSKELIDLLSPLMRHENDRHALLTLALGHNASILQRITWSGPVETFILEMVGILADYGEIESGKQALWALLETARKRVGIDQQKRIDMLNTIINIPSQSHFDGQFDSSGQHFIPRTIHVFLSCPSDVGDERAIVLKVLDQFLYEPMLRGRVTFKIVTWDKSNANIPMYETMTPEEAINQGLLKPSQCDIAIVILWSYMGTPLPKEYTKPDGSRYLSGIEWLYEDAMQAARKTGSPFIVVYHRKQKLSLDPDDLDFEQKLDQWKRVKSFFASFDDIDSSTQRVYTPYQTTDDFQTTLEICLLNYFIDQLLQEKPQPSEQAYQCQEPALWEGSPFPGLRAFGPKDAPIFFGRESETDKLVARLADPGCRFLAVVGASGSGKSSLVGAGLLPRLMGNAIPGSKDWVFIRFTPNELGSGDPFASMVAGFLRRELPIPTEYRAVTLREKPNMINAICEEALLNYPAWTEILLFIDQFEELFTPVMSNYREPFIELLAYTVTSTRIRTVVTLRDDFYAYCIEWPKLAEVLKTGSHPLAPPGLSTLYQMITCPAARAGLQFESELAARILIDTGTEPGSLALMAYTLDELYHAAEGNKQLTNKSYEELGGVQGAVGKRAESTFAKLSEEEQKILPHLFRKIVEVDERGVAVRQRAKLEQISNSSSMEQLIEAFTKARLLVKSHGSDSKSPIVEVAHEALLQNWPRLVNWIDNTRDDLHLLRQVRLAAKEWNDNNCNAAFLWPDERLKLVYEMIERLEVDAKTDFNEAEQEFIRREFDRLLEELDNPDTPHQRRSVIGERLNILGDVRPGVGLRPDGLPDISWCMVGENRVIKVEIGGQVYKVPPFYIAKYPVTYLQFQAFIDNNGYKNDEWWQELANRPKPTEQCFKFNNHPREMVSWYEAIAFCRWLSKKLGEEIQLPTEADWQAAATLGNSSQVYPWGADWDACYANTRESGLSRTTAVGIYPHSVSPCGALDMWGNVEEWTLTEYATGRSDDISNNYHRVLRGGSWHSSSELVRTAYRYRGDPVFTGNNIGFRLCKPLDSKPH